MARIRPNPKVVQAAGEQIGRAKGIQSWLEQDRLAQIRKSELARKDLEWEREVTEREKSREIQRGTLAESIRGNKAREAAARTKAKADSEKTTYERFSKIVGDPNSTKGDLLAAVTSMQSLNPNSSYIPDLFSLFKLGKVKASDEKVKAMASITNWPATNPFAWVTPKKLKQMPHLTSHIEKYFGIVYEAKDNPITYATKLQAHHKMRLRKSNLKDASKHHDLKNTESLIGNVRMDNNNSIIEYFKSTKDRKAQTLSATEGFIDAFLDKIEKGFINNPDELDAIKKMAPEGRLKVVAAIRNKLEFMKTLYTDNIRDGDRLNLNWDAKIEKHVPSLFGTLSTTEKKDKKASVPPKPNTVTRRVTNTASVEKDIPLNTTGIKIRAIDGDSFGQDWMGLSNDEPPDYLPYVYADLKQTGQSESIIAAKNISGMIDTYVNKRGWNKDGNANIILDAMNKAFGTKGSGVIPENEMREAFLTAIMMRIPKNIKHELESGSAYRPNKRLPEPRPWTKTEQGDATKKIAAWRDLQVDLENMKRLSNNISNLTGTGGQLELTIQDTLQAAGGLFAGFKNFFGMETPTIIKEMNIKMGSQINSLRDGNHTASSKSITRLVNARNRSTANLEAIDGAERRAMADRSLSEVNRTRLMGRYKAQKLFEFKKVALTYRLSSMLQGDGTGGGRTISNMDFEVAMKALWGQQEGLSARLDEFAGAIDNKIATITYERQYHNSPIFSYISKSSNEFARWDARRRTDKVIMNANRGREDILFYDQKQENLDYFQKTILDDTDKPNEWVKKRQHDFARLDGVYEDKLREKYNTYDDLRRSGRVITSGSAAGKVDFPPEEKQFLMSLNIYAQEIVRSHMKALESAKRRKNFTDPITVEMINQHFPRGHTDTYRYVMRLAFNRMKYFVRDNREGEEA